MGGQSLESGCLEYFATCGELQCKVFTDEISFDFLFRQLTKLLNKGDIQVTAEQSSAQLIQQVLVFTHRLTETRISVDSRTVVISGKRLDVAKTTLVECVLLNIFERARNLNGLFTLHASAVSLGDFAYVFIGPKESGKTTLAYTLCSRFGTSLIGNDQVLVGMKNGVISVTGGDAGDFITFRSQALQRADFQLYCGLFGESALGVLDIRKRITTKRLGIIIQNGVVPIRRIYFVGLGMTEKLESVSMSPESGMVAMYENISSRLRGATLVCLNNDKTIGTWLPDFADVETHKTILSFLSIVSNQGYLFSLRGQLSDIVSEVLHNAQSITANFSV